ncbi:MAG: hypothetical protein ICV59_09285, partial [Thermoleophilia bacterium]|nr:hypothetical protein [Thermoleophilia bacterium]
MFAVSGELVEELPGRGGGGMDTWMIVAIVVGALVLLALIALALRSR